MKITFINYLKTKNQKQVKLNKAALNMAKKPQIA